MEANLYKITIFHTLGFKFCTRAKILYSHTYTFSIDLPAPLRNILSILLCNIQILEETC